MTYVWNTDGVRIPSIAVVDLENECAIKGTALIDGLHLAWTAKITQRGWQVWVRADHGRETMWEGPTFNLILEVAAAVRRH